MFSSPHVSSTSFKFSSERTSRRISKLIEKCRFLLERILGLRHTLVFDLKKLGGDGADDRVRKTKVKGF